MYRKETLGRLLLTLLTAFVMVAGTFVAAVPTLSVEEDLSGTVEVRELEEETRVVGEAPASAFSNARGNSLIDSQTDSEAMENPDDLIDANTAYMPERTELPSLSNGLAAPDRGTRSATVEAYGPYGTELDPKYEGEIVNFDADVIGGLNDDYRFRWEVTGDGIPDGPGAGGSWGAWGETAYDHTFLDNNVGVATVQAWDGTYTTFTYAGTAWQDSQDGVNVGLYNHPSSRRTYGWSFTPNWDITVTELGGYRGAYWNYPYPQMPTLYDHLDLWDTATWARLRQTGPVYPPTDGWGWGSIAPITLEAGKKYMVSGYARPYSTTYPGYYSMPADYWTNFGGPYMEAIEVDQGYNYYYGDAYPRYGPYGSYLPLVDLKYEWTEVLENTIEDTATIFVDNVAPIVINPQAVPSGGVEGSDVGFTGAFLDPGTDDDWEYRWDFGDGTYSPWYSVNKYSGGARVLFLHCMGTPPSGYGFQDLLDELDGMGPFITQIDAWDYSPAPYGQDSAPELDYILQYDVIVVGTNYYNSHNAEIGDLLADYSDIKGAAGSGGVVTMSFSFYGSDPGLGGRWVDDDYDALDKSYSLYFGTTSMGTVYMPSHPIMDGVGSMAAYYKNGVFSVARGDHIASYTNGVVLAAAYENPMGSGARHASLNYLPSVTTPTGDWAKMIYNAIKWTSRMPDPEPLPMPIQTEIVYHTYVDDHPEHVTPQDVFQATLEVRDDDHMKLIQTGAETTIMTEDFSGFSVPPAGWTKSPWTTNWRLYYGNLAGGTYPEAQFYWYPYTTGTYRLYSYGFSTAGFTSITIRFRHYINHFSGPYNLWVETSSDAVNWDVAWELANPGSTPATQIETSTTLNVGGTTYISFTFDGNPYNINWWNIDDIELVSFPTYQMSGLGTASTPVTIANVFPTVIAPPDFDDVVEEMVSMEFTGFELTDPALKEETESFWYRWDYGDGTPIGPWINKGSLANQAIDVLFLHTYSGQINALITALEAVTGEDVVYDEYDCGPLGFNSAPSLSYLLEYDVVVLGSNYIPSPAVGNVIDDYAAAGNGVVELVAMMHPTFGIGGEWRSLGYSVFPQSTAVASGTALDIYDPTHPIIDGEFGVVDNYGCTLCIGLSSVEPGATLLADYTSGWKAAAYREEDNVHPGSGRIVGLNLFMQPGYYSGDAVLALANSIWWANGKPLATPILDTVFHDYGDNGVYDVVVQAIDDDMMWDFSGSQPVFVGSGDPNDWISFNHFPVEVNNVDPTIARQIRAAANLDLVIRTTGEPKNDCTMTLWQGATALGSVTVHHDGNYKMETLPATLDMGSINDYFVTVEYVNADPDGANPTWIFEGRFPSGHTKELKNVFKEDGTIWTIGADLLKTMLIGEDIVFTAIGADDGSDDLVFDWNFDDGGSGIHVYANADSTMVEGTSQQPEDIFNAHPNRDPWFDRAPNTIRSPDMNPIVIVDEISHAFSEGGYFFVALILMDDDVCDGYPSYQNFLNGGGYDMEFYEVDLS